MDNQRNIYNIPNYPKKDRTKIFLLADQGSNNLSVWLSFMCLGDLHRGIFR